MLTSRGAAWDDMVAAMDAVGVDGALLVSPFSMYRYDASYALEVYAKYPGRFGLIKPVDPRVLESKVGVFVGLYRQRRELVELNEALAQELRKAHGEAMEAANTDALTGVSNRRHIFQLGNAILADRRHQVQPLSLAIVDLDHFKSINDQHGHHIGDGVLRSFCAHVSQHLRPMHMLGRIGGEEFLLLMPGTSLDEAEVILDRLHRSLASHAAVSYTFSAGLAQASAGECLQAVIERADAALYGAKRAGRNCSLTSPMPL